VPAFLITIDTEGDNLWAAPATVTTRNAHYLPRFQELCERHELKPTWLTNYEMAESNAFCEFALDVVQRGAGEIGMHLHAWNSPPITDGDSNHQAYLIDYPESVMSDKVKFMTALLEENFDRKMLSHRAGRWAFDSRYARLLVENGYQIDCSVTPHVSWAGVPGAPNGAGGTDFTTFPSLPYFMDLNQIDHEGNSSLLEIPVSIVAESNVVHWLRPNGQNRNSMVAILDQALRERWPCVELMLHSSELMPGGSPTFQTERDVEGLYDDLELLFGVAEAFRGKTLSDFHDEFVQHKGARAE
jgi:hypothetical protein